VPKYENLGMGCGIIQADGLVVGPRNNVTVWSNQKRPHRHFSPARTLLRLGQGLLHIPLVPLHFNSHRAHRALRELYNIKELSLSNRSRRGSLKS
jgi:hypothetical protein